jgi:hypothetical protein
MNPEPTEEDLLAPLTEQQREALKKLWNRWLAVEDTATRPDSWISFLRGWRWIPFCTPAICVPWCGMFIAIETDGQTHS